MINDRIRWAALGAAVAVTLGAGGFGLVGATSPADATVYQPIKPCRIVDTRSNPTFNVGDRNTPIGPGEIHTVAAHGDAGECTDIPTSTGGLQLNVTAIDASAPTFLTIWGTGDQPNASSLNPVPGQPPTPNAVTIGLTTSGEFHVFNKAGFVDVIIDVVGLFTDHDHDDRYYTKSQTDAQLMNKANTRDIYTRAEVAELLAAQRNIAISTTTGNAPNLPGGDFETFGLVSIDVPRSGLLQILGSVYYEPSVDDVANCHLLLDGDEITGSLRTVPVFGTCNTNVGVEVVRGSYNIRFRGFSTDPVSTGAASLDVRFVPGGALQN